jgi:protein TonB
MSARRSGIQGVVKVTAIVDVSGSVTSAEVLTSSGHASLDQAALEAVRRAHFSPALREEKPVPCRIVIPIRFQLSVAD